MADAEEKKQKERIPTARKRDIQNEKRSASNRTLKSRLKTAVRKFESALGQEDKTTIRANLNTVYSLMDKGVKKGVLKLNKASRTKSRLSAKALPKL